MQLSVKARGDHVATFRWIEVRFMEMLAGWVPTTPETEVKLVFGTHIWDTAQHADSLGKRTHELRLPLQHSLSPTEGYVRLLADLAATTDTTKRIAGFYDCALPGLERRLRDYMTRVDPLLDAPTLRIVERILADIERMAGESRTLRDELPAVRLADRAWLDELRLRELALGDIVAPPARQEATAA
ncbi:MAG TPA: hypothetical protein VHP37_11725 [Burkholderiales bacterium]|nr:hypothetical protein [Burkholderiales bacterium]